ncbi:NAD(P)/FAD-dependent oxidoreductase [Pseudonocardia spinosispora]|uniref:NAD(P)/FAD-dependent oxidoreductase n=1 Tax=Pseudonocardia spinosispora TaxID=103441 RepID=UPI0004080A6F|nr:NAD(P)/FAD-dependent oxidoreductase [Pseudonocardia spinosispora]
MNTAPGDVDVVVVGAGIAGLSAARRLAARGLSTLILERDAHVGGRIQTERRPGVYLEHGGIFHTHGYRAMLGLLDEVGLADDVVATETGFGCAVRHHGGWEHVDYGSLTGPLRFGALTWKDRLSILRAAAPALLTRPADLGDLTTLARLDTRSASAGLTRRAATYFTAGPHEFLWGTPTDRLSFAMLAMQLHMYKGELREVRGGIGRLTDAIASELEVRTGTTVERIEETAEGVTVHLEGAEPVRAGACILAVPADEAARLWPHAPDAVRAHLTSMGYSRIDYVYLRTQGRVWMNAGGKPVGMEVVTEPEVNGGVLGGIYYANTWAERGGLLLVTASPSAGAERLDDAELADRLQTEAEKLHPELVGQVTERVVMRHHPYTPTFGPGSIRRLASARTQLPAGRIDLAGDHMTAPWVEGAVRSGQLAAERIGALFS